MTRKVDTHLWEEVIVRFDALIPHHFLRLDTWLSRLIQHVELIHSTLYHIDIGTILSLCMVDQNFQKHWSAYSSNS